MLVWLCYFFCFPHFFRLESECNAAVQCAVVLERDFCLSVAHLIADYFQGSEIFWLLSVYMVYTSKYKQSNDAVFGSDRCCLCSVLENDGETVRILPLSEYSSVLCCLDCVFGLSSPLLLFIVQLNHESGHPLEVAEIFSNICQPKY